LDELREKQGKNIIGKKRQFEMGNKRGKKEMKA
jgi:hypothetical protein